MNIGETENVAFSEDKKNIVMGRTLLEDLDEEVYYDGVCTFLEEDGLGNWTLKDGLECQNPLALRVEILRLTEANVGHEIKVAFDGGCFEKMFLSVYEKRDRSIGFE